MLRRTRLAGVSQARDANWRLASPAVANWHAA